MVEEFEEPKTEFQEKLSRRACGPFRRGDELAKRVKKLPIFPVLSLSQKRALRTAKVMAHWPLWQRKTRPWRLRAAFLGPDPEKKRQKAKVKRQKVIAAAAVVAALSNAGIACWIR